MISKPLVSVCMITYGHEKYIQQSIESILMQQTNFDFELVIANDCSPDTTDEIVNNILNTHKKANRIKYFSHSKNKGMHVNFLFALNACKSKYIALCEGDDFWIDPGKLQMQVDFLEENPDYELCFTNINIINEKGEIEKDQLIPSARRKSYQHKNLPIWAPTLTRVFKNRNFDGLMNEVLGFDSYMLLYQSKFGKLRFIDKITGTYRMHEGGVYSSKSEAEKKEAALLISIESLKLIDKSLFIKYFGLIFKKMIELKKLDIELFNKNKKKVYNCYNEYHTNLNFYKKVKVRIGFLLLSIPFSNKNSINTFIIKLLNKLFIY